jgi:hypothetical protein
MWQRHEFVKTRAFSTSGGGATQYFATAHWRAPADSSLPSGTPPSILWMFGEQGIGRIDLQLVAGDSRNCRREIEYAQRLFPEAEIHWTLTPR